MAPPINPNPALIPDPPRIKDGWDKIQTLATLLTPIILAFLPVWINYRSNVVGKATVDQTTILSKQEDTRTKIVDAAIAVLKSKPDGTSDDKQIRQWAVSILIIYTPSADNSRLTLNALLSHALPAAPIPSAPTPPISTK